MKNKLNIALLPALSIVSGFLSCGGSGSDVPNVDARGEMRNFVIGLSDYAHNTDEDFIVIPQNGIELVSENGEPDGEPVSDYLDAIDGRGI